MPGLYLGAILFSLLGVAAIARRALPGVVTSRLVPVVASVLGVFLAFDAVGSARGWFASEERWVVAILPPGIPPEEPLLLAFLALFSVVLIEAFRSRVGRRA